MEGVMQGKLASEEQQVVAAQAECSELRQSMTSRESQAAIRGAAEAASRIKASFGRVVQGAVAESPVYTPGLMGGMFGMEPIPAQQQPPDQADPSGPTPRDDWDA